MAVKVLLSGRSTYLRRWSRASNLGAVPRQSFTLFGHFVELYSTFKQTIQALSTAKCPSEFIIGDPTTDRTPSFSHFKQKINNDSDCDRCYDHAL
jgi:hypothetical protein